MKKVIEKRKAHNTLIDIQKELNFIDFTKEKEAKLNRYQARLEVIGDKAQKTERFTANILNDAISIYGKIINSNLDVDVEDTAMCLKNSLSVSVNKFSTLLEKLKNQENHSIEDLEEYVKLNRLVMTDTKIFCTTLASDLRKHQLKMWQVALELKFTKMKVGIENEKNQ